MRVWLGTSMYKKIVHLLVFLSKTIWELYSLFTSIMYKLMGNGGLWTWMHLYNRIGYTFPFSSITHKHNVQNKFHNDGVTKVVTPHWHKLNFLTPICNLSLPYIRLLDAQSIDSPTYQLIPLNNIHTNIIIYSHTL